MQIDNNTLRTTSQRIYLFVLMWYACFASSTIILRPYASTVWVILAIISFFFRDISTFKVSKLIFGYITLIIFLLFNTLISQDVSSSVLLVFKFILYFVIAYNIACNSSTRSITIKMAFVFLLIHLFIIYFQLAFPSVFNSVFLGLIPQSASLLVIKRVSLHMAIGFNTQTGIAGFWMTLGLIFSLVYSKYRTDKKIIYRLLTALFAIAIILTRKRIFVLIFIIIILLFELLTTKKSGRSFKIVVTSLIIVFLFYLASSIFPNLFGVIDKMTQLLEEDDVSNGRFQLYETALNLFKENALFGVGYGAFGTVSGLGVGVHNAYLQALVEFGLAGFFVFWIPIVKGLSISFNTVRSFVASNGEIFSCDSIITFLGQIVIMLWCFTGNPFIDDTVLFIFILLQMINISYSNRNHKVGKTI